VDCQLPRRSSPLIEILVILARVLEARRLLPAVANTP
jgi:hypothetical protein